MSEVRVEPIVYACPRCQHNGGRAYRFADAGPNLLRVLVRCENCLHRWSEMIERPVTK